MTTASIDARMARISLEITDGVARIGLRNPPLNVIDVPMMQALGTVLAEIELQPDVCVVLVSGEGKAFSAGVDVAAHIPEKVEGMLASFHSVIRALVASKKITMAAVHGPCLGGGAELAMVCDFAYTTDDAQWGFPEIKLACYPPVACTALAALVGQKRAADLILTGRTISGSEAAGIGLATRAVPADQLTVAVEDCICDLRKLSPAALAITKKALYVWDAMHFDKGLARSETIYFDSLMKTEDVREGVQAFLEKRPPKWTGK
jgi:cyclohexa-1,5-dienecarbonyl-CoA hydratase